MVKKTEETPRTEKEMYLDMIAGRINGLQAEIDTYNRDAAHHEEVTAKGMLFATKGMPYPINELAILREIARLEAARRNVKKRPN